jgi:hypothetical protein
MNIGSGPYHAFPTIAYAIGAFQDGKAFLPVAPSSAIYAHFKHISGVPAPEGVNGVNINKLKIIDTLIEQLARMKKQPDPFVDGFGQNEELRINNLLRTIQTASAHNPFAQAGQLSGALFNISV